MIEGLVSVIIPVYNVERFLDRCIDSVAKQTYKNIEIILVDDASPDKCPRICDAWAQKDARVKVIHKENAGAGMARNTGMENATGEYICFFDADDTIETDAIEVCVREARKEAADVVYFGHDRVTEAGVRTEVYVPKPPKNIYSGEEVQRSLLPMMLFNNLQKDDAPNLFLSACVCLFSNALLQRAKWCFVSEREIVSEDTYSLLQLYKYVSKAVILDRIFYHYTVNTCSQSQTYRKDRFDKLLYFYERLSALGEEFAHGESLQSGIAAAFLALLIAGMKQLVASNEPRKEKRAQLSRLLQHKELKKALRVCELSRVNSKKRILCRAMQSGIAALTYFVVWLRNLKD